MRHCSALDRAIKTLPEAVAVLNDRGRLPHPTTGRRPNTFVAADALVLKVSAGGHTSSTTPDRAGPPPRH